MGPKSPPPFKTYGEEEDYRQADDDIQNQKRKRELAGLIFGKKLPCIADQPRDF
jgi:hypothetical protein